MLTRRRFLVLAPAFGLTAQAEAAGPFRKKLPPPPPVFVCFGTDTSKGISQGIYQSRFDPATGHLTQPVLAAVTAQPSYLALSPPRNGHRVIYAVNEKSDNSSSVTTFSLDPKTGSMREIGQVSSGGAGPCYISVDQTGHAAFVADYAGSAIASFQVREDGTLSEPVDKINYKGNPAFGKPGPNAARQDAPHPHSATISPDNRFLVVNDLGSDAISLFSINTQTAHLTMTDQHLFSNGRPGSGPRHVAFHPNGRWVYGINELDSKIDHYLWTSTHGDPPQALLVNTNTPVKTIAPTFAADKNTAAEVTISLDGAYLYASNRGEDSLVVFAISAKDGALSLVQRIGCGGKTPRHFTLDATGSWLLCGNQNSGSVTVFHRDAATGKLSGPTQTIAINSPMFTLFA